MSVARATTSQVRMLSWATGVLFFGIATSASGATLRVPADYPTIQSAIDATDWGDSVLVAPGTYTTTSARNLTFTLGNDHGVQTHRAIAFLKSGITLLSEMGAAATILEVSEAGIACHCVTVCLDLSLDKTTITGFTFRKPLGSGAEVFIREMPAYWSLNMTDCVFENSDGGLAEPGGLSCRYSGPVTIANCRFSNVTSSGSHGALRAFDGVSYLTIESCLFEDCPNSAVRSTSAFFVVRNSTFRNCGTTLPSGGSAFEGSASEHLFVDACLFDQCSNTPLVFTTGNQIWPEIRRSTFVGCSGFSGVANIDAPHLVIEDCRFISCVGSASAGLRISVESGSQLRLLRNLFYRVDSQGPYGAIHGRYMFGDISNNTFVECSVGRTLNGSAVYTGSSGNALTMANNIFSRNGGSSTVFRFVGGSIAERCNDFWLNSGYNANFPLSPTSLFEDPRFCDPDVGDFALRPESPCAPPGPTECGLVGALGVLCGPVSVESMSWGKIKSLYR